VVVACWLGITKAREGICPPLPPCSRSQNHPDKGKAAPIFLVCILLFWDDDDDRRPARVRSEGRTMKIILMYVCVRIYHAKERESQGREKTGIERLGSETKSKNQQGKSSEL